MGTLWDWFTGMQWQLPVTPRGVLVGFIAGCIVGALFEAAAQAMRDVRVTKKRLEANRTARWTAMKVFAGIGILAVVAVLFMIGHDKPAAGQPQPPAVTGGR